MADYTKVTNWTAKDAANSTILGSDFETELGAVQTMSTTKANKIGSPTTDNLVSQSGTGDMQTTTLKKTKTPQVDAVVTFEKAVVWDAVNDEGTGGSVTVDWTLGNKAKYTINATGTFTFTAPGGPANLCLLITNSGVARPITFPATVKWAGGVQPTETTGVDLYTFFYDGTNYYGAALTDMS